MLVSDVESGERAYCTYRYATCDGVSDLRKDGDRLDGAGPLSNSPLVQEMCAHSLMARRSG